MENKTLTSEDIQKYIQQNQGKSRKNHVDKINYRPRLAQKTKQERDEIDEKINQSCRYEDICDEYNVSINSLRERYGKITSVKQTRSQNRRNTLMDNKIQEMQMLLEESSLDKQEQMDILSELYQKEEKSQQQYQKKKERRQKAQQEKNQPE